MSVIVAIGLGFTIQSWLLSAATLRKDHWIKFTSMAALWCLIPVAIDVLLMVFVDRDTPGDISGFALMSFLFVVPFYGFLNARLLQSINEETLMFLSLAVVYLVSLSIWHPLWFSVLIIPIIVWILRWREPLSLVAALLGYGLFLFLLITVAILQFQRIFVTLALPVSMQPGFFTLLAGSMLALYLAFHLWFAAKFIMIAITCVRSRGRALARDLLQSKVRSRHLPYPVIIMILFLQAGVYLTNRYLQWMEPALIVEASVLLLPQAVNYWLRGRLKNT
ncbi:MAG: hypothetical protein CMF59_11185 [Leptospiraceae bacterium]|nr:hypothetical protein [Leptospiraceae bacterium]